MDVRQQLKSRAVLQTRLVQSVVHGDGVPVCVWFGEKRHNRPRARARLSKSELKARRSGMVSLAFLPWHGGGHALGIRGPVRHIGSPALFSEVVGPEKFLQGVHVVPEEHLRDLRVLGGLLQPDGVVADGPNEIDMKEKVRPPQREREMLARFFAPRALTFERQRDPPRFRPPSSRKGPSPLRTWRSSVGLSV